MLRFEAMFLDVSRFIKFGLLWASSCGCIIKVWWKRTHGTGNM